MLEFETGDVLAVVFFVISGATTLIVALEKLKKKAWESSFSEKIMEKVDLQLSAVKSEIMEEVDKHSTLYSNLAEKIIEADKINAVTSDRVKSIFLKLGEFSKETSHSLQKMEDNLKAEIKTIVNSYKEDIKSVKSESKERREEIIKRIEKIEDKVEK